MDDLETRGGFVLQAGILAAAGIICRIIGILYRSPLTSIIGDEGNGYYTAAYNIYTIILLVSSYSIPSAISKVIAQRLSLKEYRNAHRIFHIALLYVIIVGGLASLFTYFFAGKLVDGAAYTVLQVFAPTIFLSGLCGVLRGYFQAHRTMVPTSVSQIIEQIVNAGVSIGAAIFFIHIAQQHHRDNTALFGAMGSAIGTGAGVLAALLIMFCIYLKNRGQIIRKVRKDKTRHVEEYREIIMVVFFVITPFILSTCIYNLSTALNMKLYTSIQIHIKDMPTSVAATFYGIFGGKSVVITNIPIAISSAISSAIIPTISSTYARKNIKATKKKIAEGIRTTMLISIPSAFGLLFLAKPVMQFLFPQKDSLDMASSLLMALSVTVIFYALSTLSNAILQSIGRVNLPVINATIALFLQTAVLVPLLLFTELNLYGLVIANIVYSFSMCVLNGISIYRTIGFKQEYKNTFIKPVLASAVMACVALTVYNISYQALKMNAVSLLIAVGVAIPVYFSAVMRFKVVKEAELRNLPKGHMLVKLAKKLKWM